MDFEISKTPEFENDVEEILFYIGSENLDAAIRFAISLEETTLLLATQPFAGFERSFDNELVGPLRFWPVKKFERYLIAYKPDREAGTVVIARVLNTYRDFEAIFS